MFCVLPANLAPFKSDDLVRIGSKNDGGYLVSSGDIRAASSLISFGVGDDWSFEQSFRKINPAPIRCYDRSVSGLVFFKRILKNILRLDNPLLLLRAISTFFGYHSFFHSDVVHDRRFIGFDNGQEYVDFDHVFSGVADSEKIFLKIDIEGSEYRILDQIVSRQHQIIGLAIEFHDVDIHLERIENFCRNFELRIIHVHANNYAPIRPDTGLPLVVEVTFSRNCSNEQITGHLVNTLDSACNPSRPDIEIEFK